MRTIAGAGGRDVEHGVQGTEPAVALSLPAEREAAFTGTLRDATRGAVVPRRLGDVLLREPARAYRSAP